MCQHDVYDVAFVLSQLLQSLHLSRHILSGFGEHLLRDLVVFFSQLWVLAVNFSGFWFGIIGRVVAKHCLQSELEPPSSVV